MKLANKTAVVTGGGSGVGLAIAKAFLREGATVIIAGRDKTKLEAAAKGLGEKLKVFQADVSDPAQADKLLAFAGTLDILVNNAGANIKERTFRELTAESWRTMLAANLDGAFQCIRAALPGMLERKSGTIININSVAGKRGGPLGGAAYSAAKFGLDGMAACLANEERESGIRVTSIFPGEIDTPILDNRPSPVTAEHRAKILRPEDVAESVLFVATQPSHVHIPELIIKPTWQVYF